MNEQWRSQVSSNEDEELEAGPAEAARDREHRTEAGQANEQSATEQKRRKVMRKQGR